MHMDLPEVWQHLVNPEAIQHVKASHSLVSCHSSDVVWELKPKKKSRWKTMSTKEVEMLEASFKRYIESGPVDNGIVDLENNYQVRDQMLHIQPS